MTGCYRRTWLTSVALAAVGLPQIAVAQDSGGSSWRDRFAVHGFLTQAYVQSTELPVFGIPEGGSADYRTGALQVRFLATANDHVVVQVEHRRLGESVLTADDRPVTLDWAYYQRRLGPVSVRAGMVPIPQGIYNEIRDVGTLLPFYRAPANIYMEGFETIDGVVVSHGSNLGDWSVDTDLVLGNFDMDMPATSPEGPLVMSARYERAAGVQTWLGTPISGLRVNAGAMSWRVEQPSGEYEGEWAWRVGLDGSFDRFSVRGEYQVMDHVMLDMEGYYGQVSADLGSRLRLSTQLEVENRTVPRMGGMGSSDGMGATGMEPEPSAYRYAADGALGLSFAQSSKLVYKIEAHRAKGYFFDQYVAPAAPAGATHYAIASVAVSF